MTSRITAEDVEDLRRFRDALSKATAEIEDRFFQLAVSGGGYHVRERVYAYELYHQLRAVMGDGQHLALHGEVDKRRHPVIGQHYKAGVAPDFIYHVPGAMKRNLAVVELKPAGARRAGILKDIRTLTRFTQKFGYRSGILLVFGGNRSRIDAIRAIVDSYVQHLQPAEMKRVELFWHSTPGTQAQFVPWQLQPN